ncbi:MAG: DMT family transporter [Hyphomicrobiaceae bacterium]
MTATTTTTHGSNLRAIAAMIASQASFIVNDTLIKVATRDLPGGQAIFLRGLMAFAMALVMAKAFGLLGPWPTRQEAPRIIARNIGEIGSTFFYLFALFNMPMADSTAILQFVPLAITASAALFLGEAVGWRRWTATVVGLIGVLIIIRPGTSAFTIWSVVALAGVAFSVLRDLSTRGISTRFPTIFLVVLSAATVTVAASGFALIETWVWPQPRSLAVLVGAALFLIGGYYFIVDAMRHGEVAVVSPFRYSVIPWAIVAGFFVFGERPDGMALLGTAIVAAAGIYTFLRERQLQRQRSPT